MTYHITIRRTPNGRYQACITDSRSNTVYAWRGCISIERAENVARGAAERQIALDRLLGKRSHVETGIVTRDAAYAWQDPYDGLWRVGDRDNAGTFRPGVSEACARAEAEAANDRAREPDPTY